jgi:hypothetical protein
MPALSAPATPSAVHQFEVLHGVTLPADFKRYLELINGFAQEGNYQDERGFNFWPLSKLSSVPEYDEGRFRFAGDENFIVYCDYLDDSWAYALSATSATSEVVLIGARNRKPKVVAKDFSQFVERYLNDDERIYA